MARWPDFFIVGAARSGTTSLYYHLRQHPDVFLPRHVKEPHFFNEIDNDIYKARRGGLPLGMIREEKQYLRLFQPAAPHQLTGEASVGYLPNYAAPIRIKEKNPEAKIIVVLRNPIDRAYSSYLLNVRQGKECNRSFCDALNEDYESMLEHQDSGSFYVWAGLYHRHIRRYLDIFGKEQVRIYLFEDLESDASEVVQDMCSFLGVEYYGGRFFNPDLKFHSYGEPRNALFKWAARNRVMQSLAGTIAPMHLLITLRDKTVGRQQAKPPLDPRAKEFLSSIYHDEIVELEGLIKRDLGTWRT